MRLWDGGVEAGATGDVEAAGHGVADGGFCIDIEEELLSASGVDFRYFADEGGERLVAAYDEGAGIEQADRSGGVAAVRGFRLRADWLGQDYGIDAEGRVDFALHLRGNGDDFVTLSDQAVDRAEGYPSVDPMDKRGGLLVGKVVVPKVADDQRGATAADYVTVDAVEVGVAFNREEEDVGGEIVEEAVELGGMPAAEFPEEFAAPEEELVAMARKGCVAGGFGGELFVGVRSTFFGRQLASGRDGAAQDAAHYAALKYLEVAGGDGRVGRFGAAEDIGDFYARLLRDQGQYRREGVGSGALAPCGDCRCQDSAGHCFISGLAGLYSFAFL